MKIFAYLKDWKSNFPERYDVDKTETIQVPHIPDKIVDEKVTSLLTEHGAAQETGKPRPCTEEERWVNRDGISLRCQDYCEARDLCSQWKKNESVTTKKQ